MQSHENELSRNTPENIKVILRQEAGFGCCRCGDPILQYHHIVPWSTKHHYNPEDMMALCVRDHYMCTLGAAPESEQRIWKSDPYNISRGYVDGQLILNQKDCIIETGTCTIGGPKSVFSINDEPLLSMKMEQNKLMISLTIYGKKNVLLAHIVDNEWIAGDPSIWDIFASFQKLKLRTQKGDVSLDIDTSQPIVKLKAKLQKDGKIIVIRPSGIRSGGSGAKLKIDHAALIDTNINFDTQQNTLTLSGGSRIGFGATPQDRRDWIIANK